MNIPDFITHYSRSKPFQSMSGVAKGQLSEVLKELNETNAWGLDRFSDPEYLERRLIVEQRIRNEFIAKGGVPILEHPIYFFLGRNTEFEKHERNKAYVIRLADLPNGTVSFTYGDSMFCFNEDYRRLKAGAYLSELCTQVYKTDELPKIFSHRDYGSSMRLHVEAQLWAMPTTS